MKLKLGKDIRYSFAIFLALTVAMQLEVNRMILLFVICTIIYVSSKSIRGDKPIAALEKLKNICRYELMILVGFAIIQILILGLGIREIVTDISVLSCVYIGIICGAISMKHYRSFGYFLNAILMFMVVFSAYYLCLIVLNGLPQGRDSALGNVSSNYCSAILYLNYPIIFYYLFARGEEVKNNKFTVRFCYIAIAMSLLVIVSSGSRTAIGVVALMALQMVFYKQKKEKNKIKIVAVLLFALLGLVIAYQVIPSVHELMERALDAFGGKNTLDNDIRGIIWAYGIQQFKNGNVFLGLGTNIVTEYVRPAHNLFYEVLLCSGYIGIVLFVAFFGILLIFIIKKQKYQQRFFTIMLMAASIITLIVQPFFSTSYTCGMMVWMALFTLTADAERRLP